MVLCRRQIGLGYSQAIERHGNSESGPVTKGGTNKDKADRASGQPHEFKTSGAL